MKRFLRNNGLSLVLITAFGVFLIGQALTGWQMDNDARREKGQPPLALSSYLGGGAFWESVFENWESEFLQMGAYVVLTAFLYQKGSAESNDPDGMETKKSHARGSTTSWVYAHSLSLSLFTLFLVSFLGHLWSGTRQHNDEAVAQGRPEITAGAYLASAQFWFESLQNWQSEFLAVFSLVVLSIWLREKNSPESKKLGDPPTKTGK